MPAGDSAGAEARRQIALADAHTAAAAEARATAARYGIADVTEKATARALAPLAAVGHHLLADRRWPGSRRAQVDLVVVGPGGVFVVDTKAWRDVSIGDGRIYRGQEDATDDLMNLADLGYTIEGALADVGLAPGEVHVVAVLAGRASVNESVGPVRVVGEKDVLRHIASFGARLTPSQVDAVLAATLTLLPEVNAPAPISVTVPQPALPRDTHPIQDALLSDDEVQSALLDGMLAAPIEEWMSFLHPAQARLVRRTFKGPARIRGAAGTGKTVVALHRAAYLARSRPGRILVTTYIRTLPDVLRSTLERMAPDAVDRVDFMGVHEFASRLLDERGVRIRLDGTRINEAFHSAWRDIGAPGVLGASSRDSHYWKDEIAHIIKGRGLTTFEEYAALTRAGRRYPLTVEQRRAVWDLRVAYDERLRTAGVLDWADQILLAEHELDRKPMTDRYTAVVVDEAQDLSSAMVRMLYRLVGDRDDAFLLVGDGQQTIYPGGYTLAEIGVDIAGRGVVLDANYRNTQQILDFASRLVAGDEYAEIDGVIGRGERPARVEREGPQPTLVRCGSWAQREKHLIAHVQTVLRTVGTGPGDIGVLCLSRHAVRASAAALRKAGIPVTELTAYDGRPTDGVKVGTIKRAKGLEFKQVLLPDVRQDDVSTTPPAGRHRARAVDPAAARGVRRDDSGERRVVGGSGLSDGRRRFTRSRLNAGCDRWVIPAAAGVPRMRMKIAIEARCATTGIPVKEVLDAAHVIPVADCGPTMGATASC
ncbi:UvrD-helicase domain-containing protein [Cellulomonas fengjieae]|uniref:ATP-dependent helicase n=1 Tax=Cellulomonas fengjieae TaxID=2819978 RepID=A0ABS3SG59_9CELL|nr:UvrD-helicase domain-containing protein [Cellulomonas fengjieae]MBO3084747.1 ATP-dependent helicase [Cellulomonas fengjieae]QVI66933.1 ATP-dependent helicase [Cellulomonas fengjieae]